MTYLMENSEIENTITVVKENGRKFHVPVGVFDNRVDKTSFLRQDQDPWDPEKVEEMTAAVRKATDAMFEHYQK